MIIYEVNTSEVEYHPELKVLEIRWIAPLEEDLMLLWRKAVALSQQYTIECILLDASNIDPTKTPAFSEPLLQHFFNQPISIANLKKIARVGREAAADDQKLQQLAPTLQSWQLRSNLEFANFHYHYEAMEWLVKGVGQFT